MATGKMDVGFNSARVSSPLLDEDFGAALRELAKAGAGADAYIDCDPSNMTCPPKEFTSARQSNPATIWSVAEKALMSIAIMSSLRSTFADYDEARTLSAEGYKILDEAAKLLGSGAPLAKEDAKYAADAALEAGQYFERASRMFRILAASQDDRISAFEIEIEAAEAAVARFAARAFLADERVSHGKAADDAQDVSQMLQELKQSLERAIPNGLTVERQSLMEQLKIRVVFLIKAEEIIRGAILKKGMVGREVFGIVLQRSSRRHTDELTRKIPLTLAESDKAYVLERIKFALNQPDETQKLAILSRLFTDIGLASSYEDFITDVAFGDEAADTLRKIGVPEENILGVREIAERECLRLAAPAGLIDNAWQILLQTSKVMQVDYYQASLRKILMAERMLKLAGRHADADIVLKLEIQKRLAFASEIKSTALMGLQRSKEVSQAWKDTVAMLIGYANGVTEAASPEKFPDASAERLRWIAAEAALMREHAYHIIYRHLKTPDPAYDEKIEAEEQIMANYVNDESNPLSERAGFLSQRADVLRYAAERLKTRGWIEKVNMAFIKASEAHKIRAELIEKHGGERGEKLSFRDYAEIGYSLTAAADILGKTFPNADAEAAASFKESRWAMYSHASTAFYRAGRALSSDGGHYSQEAVRSLHLTWAYASLRQAQLSNGEAIATSNAIRTIIEAIRLTGDVSEKNNLILQGETVTLHGLLAEALKLKHSGEEREGAVAAIVSKEQALIYIGLMTGDKLVTADKREAMRELFKEAGFQDVPGTEAEFMASLREGRYDVVLRARGVSDAKIADFRRPSIRASEAEGRRGWDARKSLFGK
ncbi:MAG: hypothetical protein HYY43_04935 [Deltaproteobacteria bacterium]|nr:hypothetical protein [Deltaproteobacteria bacterium]